MDLMHFPRAHLPIHPQRPHLKPTPLLKPKPNSDQPWPTLDPSPANPNRPSHLNSLIPSLASGPSPLRALQLYAYLRSSAGPVEPFSLPSLLKASARLSALLHGQELHSFALKSSLIHDTFVQNALLHMYFACGALPLARQLFDEMPQRDSASWSTMINCCRHSKLLTEALGLIRSMQFSSVRPTGVALLNMISVATDVEAVNLAREMHAYVLKNCNDHNTAPLETAFLHMYVKCGSIALARRIFDQMVRRSVVSWTTMIAGYVSCRSSREATRLLGEMERTGLRPNEITMLSLAIECGGSRELEFGKWLHAYVMRCGFKLSVVLATALVDMYGKCGAVDHARALFDGLDERDVKTWTALISGYAMAGRLDRAFEAYAQMRKERVEPNEVTLVTLLSLCAERGALDRGKCIHSFIAKGAIECDVVLTTTLVNMYAKCGEVGGSYTVFSRAPSRDAHLWNAMMSGLAMHGLGKEVLELLLEMESAGLKPNNITFVSILHACSHAGLVEEGRRHFSRMVSEFGLVPKIEHYGCMVDLLGRAGLLDEAYEMIKAMPIEPNTIVWGALLAACRLHRNVKLGEMAAEQLLALHPDNCGYSVLMSNLYATANQWNDVADLRRSIKDKGVKKEPGFSSIEVNGTTHEFVMGDCSHLKVKQIYEMLFEMNKKLKLMGYVPNPSAALLNVEEEEKETALTYHSEKLAMAFGLISTAPTSPIRIVKNLRICDDCHSATKLLSRIYNRVIIVRDRNRFHHFSHGLCSCRDYW